MAKTSPPRPPAAPPASAEEGALHVRKFMVQLFDRKDGHAVDWKMIAGTLFLAGFNVLDELPEKDKAAFARRIHERSYVVATGEPAPSHTEPGASDSGPSNTAGLKSRAPKPPRQAFSTTKLLGVKIFSVMAIIRRSPCVYGLDIALHLEPAGCRFDHRPELGRNVDPGDFCGVQDRLDLGIPAASGELDPIGIDH
jgi:hypothetical protein